MDNDWENFRRKKQAALLIFFGFFGIFGTYAGIDGKDYTTATSCGLGCIAALSLAVWRLKHLVKDTDSKDSDSN
jgi:hypothetical protein